MLYLTQVYGVSRNCNNTNIFHFNLLFRCLNSLWGKFSMKNDYSSSEIVTTPSQYYKLIFDHRKVISMIIPMDDDAKVLRVVHKPKEGFVEEHKFANILISL